MSAITRVCTLALMGIILLFVGCGSSNSNSSSNPTHLTQAQALQLGTETFTDAFAALKDVAGQVGASSSSDPRSNPLAVLSKHRHASEAATSGGISCTSSSCTITSFVYDCADGGTITINGSASSESSSSASLDLTLTPASCSDGTLVVNGNPDITVNAQGSENGTTVTVTASIGGDVAFAPVQAGAFPSGSCASDLSVNASASESTDELTSCSISGTICGYTVNISSCPE